MVFSDAILLNFIQFPLVAFFKVLLFAVINQYMVLYTVLFTISSQHSYTASRRPRCHISNEVNSVVQRTQCTYIPPAFKNS